MTPQIIEKITYFLALILSLSIHEWAHAFMAKLEGDDTAEKLGRLSLNPIVHMDMIGTIALPMLSAFTGLPLIGWAKPVPVNPANFRHSKFGDGFVASAGPISNLILSALSVLLLALYSAYFEGLVPEGSFFYPIINLLKALALINAILAFFNLIPLPPLDGGAVISSIIPKKLGDLYQTYVSPYGIFILFMLIYSNRIGWVYELAMGFLGLVQGIILPV